MDTSILVFLFSDDSCDINEHGVLFGSHLKIELKTKKSDLTVKLYKYRGLWYHSVSANFTAPSFSGYGYGASPFWDNSTGKVSPQDAAVKPVLDYLERLTNSEYGKVTTNKDIQKVLTDCEKWGVNLPHEEIKKIKRLVE